MMTAWEPNTRAQEAAASGTQHPPLARVLVVEPEALVRWSLVTYLARWFDVLSADSRSAADKILDDQQVDAVVVSDDLSDRAVEDVEAHARSRNPDTRVIRTVTGPPSDKAADGATPRLEKPFDLSRLATLLGVQAGSRSGLARGDG
jgi:DNA-binding NtrC family response regulator